jgi:tetratricopeptide (TPR) repeat protein/pimeloyl-ACP methyl ester carboxylesterase
MSGIILRSVQEKPASCTVADLVFVHGIGANELDTWRTKRGGQNVFWPLWISEDLSNLYVWTLGYPAERTRWSCDGSAMALPDRSYAILRYLVARQIGTRPIFFVGHSLGGLIIKQVLRDSYERQGEQHGQIAKNFCGVAFIATPNVGSQIANLANALVRAVRPSPALKDLKYNDANLRALHSWYSRTAARQKWQTLAFFENQNTHGIRVVDEISANPGIPGSEPIGVDADHISISRPETRQSPLYVEIKVFLQKGIQELARTQNLANSGSPTNIAVQIDEGRMPTTDTLPVGRQQEFEWLDAAWEDQRVGVAALIALGGVGKTTIARNWWLRHPDRYSGLRVEEFSFYNQGASSGSQGSAEAFITRAFSDWFKAERPASFWNQGRKLAQLVRDESIILILDGLEPLQHPYDPHFGYFSDERLAVLLQELASSGSMGLCICTSRLPLNNLKGYIGYGYRPLDLRNLSSSHGAELLKRFGIKGTDAELTSASQSFGNHALSLNLIAKYISEYHADRDINRIDNVPSLSSLPIADEGEHARRILRHYETIFPRGTPENAILRCVGLFDRPATPESLSALRQPPAIPGLTDSLVNLSALNHANVFARLKRLGLVEYERALDPVDCHPIIRSHFCDALKTDAPAWREGNRRLYLYYSVATPDERPTTQKGMEPLYSATVHACRAGAYAKAWSIYWNRIQQGHPTYFNTNALGAMHAGLASLASFYNHPPWSHVADGVEEALSRKDFLRLLTEVGFHLKQLGRFEEAREVIRSAMHGYDADSEFEQAAVNAESLAETYLYEGDLTEALSALGCGRNGVQYAELSSKPFRRMQTLALRGQILHYAGRMDEAERALLQAESIRAKDCSGRQPIRSLYLLDLLGELGRYEELRRLADLLTLLLDERNAKAFTGGFYLFLGAGLALRVIRGGEGSLADEALEHLTRARRLIDESMLPHLQTRAPCARARLLTTLGRFEDAKNDLAWALSVSEHARLRIFEIDCHVGLCHLYLARDEKSVAASHLAAAQRLMATGSYARPQRWIDDLTKEL